MMHHCNDARTYGALVNLAIDEAGCLTEGRGEMFDAFSPHHRDTTMFDLVAGNITHGS